jgi:hypothetical protein
VRRPAHHDRSLAMNKRRFLANACCRGLRRHRDSSCSTNRATKLTPGHLARRARPSPDRELSRKARSWNAVTGDLATASTNVTRSPGHGARPGQGERHHPRSRPEAASYTFGSWSTRQKEREDEASELPHPVPRPKALNWLGASSRPSSLEPLPHPAEFLDAESPSPSRAPRPGHGALFREAKRLSGNFARASS